MRAEELVIVREAVHNALETVRCLEAEMGKGMVTKKDLRTFLGGNLEGKLEDAFKILEAEVSAES